MEQYGPKSSFDNPQPDIEDSSPIVETSELRSSLHPKFAEELEALEQIILNLDSAQEQSNIQEFKDLVRVLQQKLIVLFYNNLVPESASAHFAEANSHLRLTIIPRHPDSPEMRARQFDDEKNPTKAALEAAKEQIFEGFTQLAKYQESSTP